MMLWYSECKKLLLNHKGLLILTACLLLKAVFLMAFPEQKDPRIALSQKQYDYYLSQVSGPNTPEKERWLLDEYENCKAVLDNQERMRENYKEGIITEEEWKTFSEALTKAELHRNSAELFAEKVAQFQAHSPTLQPADYIYEYGWQTVFTILQLPDVFLLIALLLLTAQCYCGEAANGMLPILLAAKDGRGKLFRTKLLALSSITLLVAILNCGIELLIFSSRGFLNDSQAPLYSVSILTSSSLPLSLAEGYALCLATRILGSILTTQALLGISVVFCNSHQVLFLGVCTISMPFCLPIRALTYTHAGLFAGTQVLISLRDIGDLVRVTAIVTTCTMALCMSGYKRHTRAY